MITGTRVPAETEKAAARRLARALRAAAIPGRTPVVITSAAPPGRLRMRQALGRDAQRAAGAVPFAEPFSSVVRRRQPVPPLHVGIACDVSGSMGAFAGPVASAAWILANAAGSVTGTRTATVIYGDSVRPVTRPGRAAAHVTEFAAVDGAEKFCQAVDALDAALDLARPWRQHGELVDFPGAVVEAGRAAGLVPVERCVACWLGCAAGS
jgi:hypothetical protein